MDNVTSRIIRTYKASVGLRNAEDKTIRNALKKLADEMERQAAVLLKANKKDLEKQDPLNSRTDRLLLNEQRIGHIAGSIRKISGLPNPSGRLLEKRKLENGLLLEKVTVPLGVVGAIYESRPNVTFDIAALCLRSQNGCVLKGSAEAEHTNTVAMALIKKVLKESGIDPDVVTLLPSARETVQELFTATKYIDVLIPRGSDSLIQYVRKNSMVPVIETGAGVCHIYVEQEADVKKALDIVVNAKVSRPSVCNAVDAVLVDKAVAAEFLQKLGSLFLPYEVEVLADPRAYKLMKGYPFLKKAGANDFGKEFLSLRCAVKVVGGIDEALLHISAYSTRHSEAIVTRNKKQAERFLREVDAAAVYANASTRFTDGEAFGLGAEIGISTQKLHARGPFALEKLITEKWIIRGTGQIRV
ncbi:MAG: glutamate-5-semialdehyde dehydrogenase [Chitinophagaceae bacterium]|nr:glutamate-5-semialdehyde dehydrogenase [Chitinophagaceae bacterium]